MLQYRNSNHLVDNPDWQIGLQKTGYISEAGRCLVMQTQIEARAIVMVFLDSKGKSSRLADAGRIRKWLENARPTTLPIVLDTAVVRKAWKDEAAPAPLAKGSMEIALKLDAVKASAIMVADWKNMKVNIVSIPATITAR